MVQASRLHAGSQPLPGACPQLAKFALQAPWKLKSNTGPGHARHRSQTDAFVHILLFVTACVLAQRRANWVRVFNPVVIRDSEFAT